MLAWNTFATVLRQWRDPTFFIILKHRILAQFGSTKESFGVEFFMCWVAGVKANRNPSFGPNCFLTGADISSGGN